MTQDTTWTVAMAETYDRMMGPVTFQPYADRLAALARELQPQQVLELAAGSGIVTAALLQELPGAAVTATDLNDGMIAYGRTRVPGASWQTADAQDIPFPDASFDLVVCAFGVMFFPDRVRAYAEMARVLVPGGRCLISIWDVLASSHFESAVTDSLAVLLPDDPPTFLARVPHGYTDTALIRSDIEAGGLVVESIDRVVEITTAPSAAWVAEGYCQGSPLRFALEQQGSLPELTDALTRELTARLGDGPLTGEMSAFLVTARKA